jgi:hypothetical protein
MGRGFTWGKADLGGAGLGETVDGPWFYLGDDGL